MNGQIYALSREFLTNIEENPATNWCTLGRMTEDIETRVAGVCGILNAAHAQLVKLVAEVVETRAWDVPGIRTAEQWVAWKTGFSFVRAKQIVQIAGRSTELPVTLQTFTDGELSIDQVAVVAKYTPPRTMLRLPRSRSMQRCRSFEPSSGRTGRLWSRR